MPQSFIQLHYHIVFSTKHREPSITTPMQSRLYEYIGGILRKDDGDLISAGGMPDHIHLLARLTQRTALADVLRVVKTNSSKWIHESFPESSRFQWQSGYGAFTVSFSGIEEIKRYHARQEDHHRTMTFQEEFCELLRRHKIEFDERYLWE